MRKVIGLTVLTVLLASLAGCHTCRQMTSGWFDRGDRCGPPPQPDCPPGMPRASVMYPGTTTVLPGPIEVVAAAVTREQASSLALRPAVRDLLRQPMLPTTPHCAASLTLYGVRVAWFGRSSLLPPWCSRRCPRLPSLAMRRSRPRRASRERSRSKTQKWEFGVSIRAVGGPCAGLFGTFPLPADWPEQQVKVIEEDDHAARPRHSFRESEGLKQMLFEVPQLAAGETATCFITLEIVKTHSSAAGRHQRPGRAQGPAARDAQVPGCQSAHRKHARQGQIAGPRADGRQDRRPGSRCRRSRRRARAREV